MRPVVIEMKLDLKCLNKTEREKIFYYFAECRWLCTHLISMSGDEFRSFNTHTRDIWSYDKEKNKVERHLEIPAKFIRRSGSSIFKHQLKLQSDD